MRLFIAAAVLLLTRTATGAIVDVGGMQNVYAPQTITIQAGDAVTFINKGGFHNVVADDGTFRCSRGCDGDGMGGNGSPSSANWVFTLKFPQAGRFGYFCEVHGAPRMGMFGTVIVQGPLTTTPVPAVTLRWLALLSGALVFGAGLVLRRRRGRCKAER